MVTHEEMKEMIQEWLGQEITTVDLAKTYAVCMEELNRQLECNVEILERSEENN